MLIRRLFSSVDPKETLRFSSLKWWSPANPLHTFSDLRIKYIMNQVHLSNLNGLKVLDVGCGGGLMCERLAQQGADVTGVDPTENAIQIAQSHLPDDLKDKVKYVLGEVTDINDKFDLILSSEVIEHVNDPEEFLIEIVNRLKPRGDLFLSTLNKTFESWFCGILWAEHILGTIDPGTHTWSKFIPPEVLKKSCEKNKLEVWDVQGWVLDPINVKAYFADYTRIGYLMHCRKPKDIQ